MDNPLALPVMYSDADIRVEKLGGHGSADTAAILARILEGKIQKLRTSKHNREETSQVLHQR